MSKLESKFKSDFHNKILRDFPDAIIIHNDPTCLQGIPDTTVIFGSVYILLEFKRNEFSHHQPNQNYYIQHINKMNKKGFATFIYPANAEEVYDEIYRTFKFER